MCSQTGEKRRKRLLTQRPHVPKSSFWPHITPSQTLWPLAASNPSHAGSLAPALHNSSPPDPAPALPAWRVPSPPYSSAPRHAPQVSPRRHHLAPPQLVFLSPFSQGCFWPPWPTENASQLLWPTEPISPFRDQAQFWCKKWPETHPKSCTYKNLHAKDFRAEEYEIPGGKKTQKNLFPVFIWIIFKLLIKETWGKTGLYLRQK